MTVDQLADEMVRLRGEGYGSSPVHVLDASGTTPPADVLSVQLEHHEDAGGAHTVWLRVEEI